MAMSRRVRYVREESLPAMVPVAGDCGEGCGRSAAHRLGEMTFCDACLERIVDNGRAVEEFERAFPSKSAAVSQETVEALQYVINTYIAPRRIDWSDPGYAEQAKVDLAFILNASPPSVYEKRAAVDRDRLARAEEALREINQRTTPQGDAGNAMAFEIARSYFDALEHDKRGREG